MDREAIKTDELKALYLLNNMHGMYSDKLLRIYEHFTSFADAYRADAKEYYEAGLFVRKQTGEAFDELKRRENTLLHRAESFGRQCVVVAIEKTGLPMSEVYRKLWERAQ